MQALGLRPATLLKKSLWYRCFPVNVGKFLRTSFFTEHLRWLLLSSLQVYYEETTYFQPSSRSSMQLIWPALDKELTTTTIELASGFELGSQDWQFISLTTRSLFNIDFRKNANKIDTRKNFFQSNRNQ